MKKKLRKKAALVTALAMLMCQPAFAVTDSTTYDGTTFSYGLSGDGNSVSAYCIYLYTDTTVNISTNVIAYEFKISSPLTVKTKTDSASRTANNSVPALVNMTPDTGYEFYRAKGTYKVWDANGSLTKTLSASV